MLRAHGSRKRQVEYMPRLREGVSVGAPLALDALGIAVPRAPELPTGKFPPADSSVFDLQRECPPHVLRVGEGRLEIAVQPGAGVQSLKLRFSSAGIRPDRAESEDLGNEIQPAPLSAAKVRSLPVFRKLGKSDLQRIVRKAKFPAGDSVRAERQIDANRNQTQKSRTRKHT